MPNTKEQVLSFLEKCEELKNCKFIMATTKIKDLLKCIVNCPELYRLFETVTKNFDYPAAKSECLISVNDGVLPTDCVVLPETVGRRLAFIFCLLVEFDKDTVNFNDFLRLYFPEDGSYFASYRAFCNIIIKGLQECILQVFKDELDAVPSSEPNSDKAEILSALEMSISQEMYFIADYAISAEDKENGIKILSGLLRAVRLGNIDIIDSLVCGYNYFVLHLGCVSDAITELIQLVEDYEKTL